jgi:uncharacterized membrane protein YiaA
MQFQQDSAAAHTTHNSLLIWIGCLVIGLYMVDGQHMHPILLHVTFICGLIGTVYRNSPHTKENTKKATLEWAPGFLPRGKAAGA